MGQHLLPAGAHGFCHAARFKQPPVEGRQEHLRAADVERIGHGHHAAHAALQQRRGHRRESVAGLGVQHPRLAGVQHHGWDGVLMQQGAQVAGGFRIGLAICIFEDQSPLEALQHVRRVLVRAVGIGPMTVEVERVIVTGVGAEVFAKLVESRRAEHIHARGQAARLDQFDERAGDGPVADIASVWPRDHQQDVDAVFGERAALRRVRKVVEAALDAALMREVITLRVEEGFPGPGKDVRVVAADLQDFGVRQPLARVAAVEQRVECLRAPALQGVQNAPSVADFRVERIIEKMLQIPTQFVHEIGVRLTFDGKLVGRRYRHRRGGLAVLQAV